MTLTDDIAAIGRASDAVERLDRAMAEMRKNGQLQIFNRAYRERRDAAAAKGQGFMACAMALGRLKAAMAPQLRGQVPR